MSERADVLLWAQRVIRRRDATACQILEIAPGSGPDAAQAAFHKIARMAHPDLHRRRLLPEELELVTTAYARAAAAYQELRGQRTTSRIQPIPGAGPPSAKARTTAVIPTSPPSNKAIPVSTTDEPANPAPDPAPDPAPNPAPMMNPRALVHYRKAELSLRRGDLTGAVLQLKMAIASDPQSQLLRSALAEIEAEVRRKP